MVGLVTLLCEHNSGVCVVGRVGLHAFIIVTSLFADPVSVRV